MTDRAKQFKAAIDTFSDASHDEALGIRKFDDHPSVPADMVAAEEHFTPGEVPEEEVLRATPNRMRIVRRVGGVALASGVIAWAGLTGGFDKDPGARYTAQEVAAMQAEQQQKDAALEMAAEAQNH